MQPTRFIWHNGRLVKWEDAQVHVLTHSLHYGASAFEGIRAYRTELGGAVFRLREHIERLLYSASVLQMELSYSAAELETACIELLRANEIDEAYLRPLVYFGYGKMGLNPAGAPVEIVIACWPWDRYLPYDMVDLKVSRYIRIHPDSTVCDAKLSGHYVNSILAVLELKGSKYHEALLLDTEGCIAEGPGENFFAVLPEGLVTPPLGTILRGITRETVIMLAHRLGLPVVERKLPLEEALTADEAFFTGTAAEVIPIRSINDQLIGGGAAGETSLRIKDAYTELVHGRSPDSSQLLTYIRRGC